MNVKQINKQAVNFKGQVFDLLAHYAMNSINSSDVAEFLKIEDDNSVSEVLGEFQRDWDDAECDSEGPTSEQEKALDNIQDYFADKLIRLTQKIEQREDKKMGTRQIIKEFLKNGKVEGFEIINQEGTYGDTLYIKKSGKAGKFRKYFSAGYGYSFFGYVDLTKTFHGLVEVA